MLKMIFPLIMLLSLLTYAQDEEVREQKQNEEKQSEELFHDLDPKKFSWEHMTLSIGIIKPTLALDAGTDDENVDPLRFSPSTQGKSAITIDYKNYGLTLSAFSPKTEDFKREYGNGRAEDYQFRFLYNGFYLESYYQKYKGYYLDEPGKVMTNPKGPNGEYPQFPNLKTEHYGVQVVKIFNIEGFNPRRAIEFIDEATKTGSSWFVAASINKHKMTTPDTIVPATAIDNYAELMNLRRADSTTIAVGGGGAFSYVYRDHWVLSGLFGIGLGPQWMKAKYTNERESSNRSATKLLLKFGTGYSGKKFFVNLQSNYDTTLIQNRSTELSLSTIETGIFFGWRL